MNDFRIAGNKPSDRYFPAPDFLPAYQNERKEMVKLVNIALITRSGIRDLEANSPDLDAIDLTSHWQKLFIHISVLPAKNVCGQS